jgi:hypothetical protein
MPWKIGMTLKNPLDRDFNCTIRKGQVFENEKIGTGYQNVAAAKDYSFLIPANSTLEPV